MIATLTENEQTTLEESLRRCSPATLQAALRFRQKGDFTAIPMVVFGILERYQPATAPIKLSEASQDVRLVEDIGLDSLTLLEIVMNIEEVLKIRIENNELRQLHTLGNLNEFLQSKMGATPAKPSGRHYSRSEITLLLPQQPPFLFLDDAEIFAEEIKASYLVKGDEFFLEGHFKNRPIFPASIVFEAMGQAACLWSLEMIPAKLNLELNGEIFFAALDGAHFYQAAQPGDKLQFEIKLSKLRKPLVIFSGLVLCKGKKIARIERLVLAFGEPPDQQKIKSILSGTPHIAEMMPVTAANGVA